MSFEDFYHFVNKTIDELIETAEIYRNTKFDFHEIEFQWVSLPPVLGREAVIFEIMDKIYVDEEHIYPCVDLIFRGIKNGVLKIQGTRANYPPRAFGIGWSGRLGPFIYSAGIDLKEEDRQNVIKLLIKKGLLPQKKNE